jgi:hypothetical protein
LEAQRLYQGDPLRLTPNTYSLVFASYIHDVNRVASTDTDGPPGVVGEDHPGLPGRENWGARLDREEIRTVMTQVFKEDKNGFLLVAGAQTVWANKLLDAGAARIAAGQGTATLSATAQQIGSGFGLITDAAGLAKLQKGQELDEAQQRNAQILLAVVNTGLAIPEKAAWPIAAGAVAAWTSFLEDSAKGTAAQKAVVDANVAVTETRTLVHQLGAQALLNHGLFGSADPPDKTHPWASLSDLRPGDDPRRAPNNFLKDDGKTLLTREELLAITDARGNPVAWDAYRKWAYEGLAGETWQDVQSRLSEGFTQGFGQYGGR